MTAPPIAWLSRTCDSVNAASAATPIAINTPLDRTTPATSVVHAPRPGVARSQPAVLNASGQEHVAASLELARLQNVSVTPVIGGSLNMFLTEDSPMTTDYTEIADKKVNFIGFAGVAGRFDVGGTR